MRILYIDIDSQRPDHFGCYGYHRDTSPNIDRIAAAGVRFDNYYVSDAPCLPSRTAMWSGRFGFHNGVINHGGVAADPFVEGKNRSFRSTLGQTNWMWRLRQLGHKTATISPFGERHSAWHWYAGWNEIFNTGKGGLERADEIAPLALDWIAKNARAENWFLHVNLWDPHTPYRTPETWGNPLKDSPLPAWLSEDVRQQHWAGGGPHSAQEICGYDATGFSEWPMQPACAASMDDVRRMFDGYDRGVRYADEHIGKLFNALADQNVFDQTVIIISADHGENLGELNIYGDHQTADQITSRVPLIVKWPGVTASSPRVDSALHYHFDFAATMIELLGGKVPENWDGQSFAQAFRAGKESGRPYLVLSQGAWSCQRAIRFENWMAIHSYHDGYHGFPPTMLFDVKSDPHEQHDLAGKQPQVAKRAMDTLTEWEAKMMRTATTPIDPMRTVLAEGGPFHTRGHLSEYLKRLRATGRSEFAERLDQRRASECT